MVQMFAQVFVQRGRSVMHRARVPAVGCALVAVASMAVAPPAAAGPVFHLSFHGELALAAWTTCPEPELGDLCADTVVIASDSRTRENTDLETGGHFIHDSGDRLVLQRFWYEIVEFDGQLQPRPLRESFGGTDNASVEIHNRLTDATATATVPMDTTDYVTGEESSGTDSVSVRWLPVGPLERMDERDRSGNRQQIIRSWTTGWSRDATATGTLDGSPIQGSQSSGGTMLVHANQGELSIIKGRPIG